MCIWNIFISNLEWGALRSSLHLLFLLYYFSWFLLVLDHIWSHSMEWIAFHTKSISPVTVAVPHSSGQFFQPVMEKSQSDPSAWTQHSALVTEEITLERLKVQRTENLSLWWKIPGSINLQQGRVNSKQCFQLYVIVCFTLCPVFTSRPSGSRSSCARFLGTSPGSRPERPALSSSPWTSRSETPWRGGPFFLWSYPRSSPAGRPAESPAAAPRGGPRLLWRRWIRWRRTLVGFHTEPWAVISSSSGKSVSTSLEFGLPSRTSDGDGWQPEGKNKDSNAWLENYTACEWLALSLWVSRSCGRYNVCHDSIHLWHC